MGILRVGTATPVRPFTGMPDGGGLDVDLMTAVAEHLGDTVEFVAEDGSDLAGVLEWLSAGRVDCVAAGVVVTDERATTAQFAPPYLITGQALAVDTARLPQVRSVDDLDGLTVAVVRGDSGEAYAQRLVDDAKAAAVTRYDHGDLAAAVRDVAAGRCDALLAPAPVLTELVREAGPVEVVQKGLTTEHVAIAVAASDQRMLSRLTVAQAELEADGTLQAIRRRWLGNPYADQRLALH